MTGCRDPQLDCPPTSATPSPDLKPWQRALPRVDSARRIWKCRSEASDSRRGVTRTPTRIGRRRRSTQPRGTARTAIRSHGTARRLSACAAKPAPSRHGSCRRMPSRWADRGCDPLARIVQAELSRRTSMRPSRGSIAGQVGGQDVVAAVAVQRSIGMSARTSMRASQRLDARRSKSRNGIVRGHAVSPLCRGVELASTQLRQDSHSRMAECQALSACADTNHPESADGATSAIRPHQHSMTLTASPPSLVSLYLCDMSMPVCRIVSTTASSET